MVHHRHADRQRVFEPEADVANTVTNEDDIDGGVRNSGCNRVVRSGHDETSPLLRPPLQHRNCYALNRRLRNVTHTLIPLVDDFSSIRRREAAGF
jgi:hypothetical protein